MVLAPLRNGSGNSNRIFTLASVLVKLCTFLVFIVCALAQPV